LRFFKAPPVFQARIIIIDAADDERIHHGKGRIVSCPEQYNPSSLPQRTHEGAGRVIVVLIQCPRWYVRLKLAASRLRECVRRSGVVERRP
jgi:hypothetical protein